MDGSVRMIDITRQLKDHTLEDLPIVVLKSIRGRAFCNPICHSDTSDVERESCRFSFASKIEAIHCHRGAFIPVDSVSSSDIPKVQGGYNFPDGSYCSSPSTWHQTELPRLPRNRHPLVRDMPGIVDSIHAAAASSPATTFGIGCLNEIDTNDCDTDNQHEEENVSVEANDSYTDLRSCDENDGNDMTSENIYEGPRVTTMTSSYLPALNSVTSQHVLTLRHVRSLSCSDDEICELLGNDSKPTASGDKTVTGPSGWRGQTGWESTAFCPIEVEKTSPVAENVGGRPSSRVGRTTRWCRPPGRCHINKTSVINRPSLDFDKMQRHGLATKSVSRRIRKVHVPSREIERILQEQRHQQSALMEQQQNHDQLQQLQQQSLFDPAAVFSFRSISLPLRCRYQRGGSAESR